MLNIPLLNWATEETCDPRYRQVAMAHADAVMQSFIRDDGSSDHIVEFDPSTGERLRAHGGQGYRNGSAWTRGQGWAIYGFAIAHAPVSYTHLDVYKRQTHSAGGCCGRPGAAPASTRSPSSRRRSW